MREEFLYKTVADPVHKCIGLSELEVKIIDTPIFQRLRNIKSLGLVYYVFPGADYSRFSHSLGAMHIMGRIAERLFKTQREIQLYRLAALLHDVGHYPFSHALETPMKKRFEKEIKCEHEYISELIIMA